MLEQLNLSGGQETIFEALEEFEGLAQARDDEAEAVRLTAEAIMAVFDAYYAEYNRLAWAAKEAFENRDPATSLTVARRRLTIYSETIHQVARRLTRLLPELTADEPLWRRIEEAYAPLTAGRYEQDLALAYIHSARRLLFQDEWTPVEYSFGTAGQTEQRQITVHRVFPGGATITPELVVAILRAPEFNKPFQDIELDAAMVAERANRDYGFDGGDPRAFQAIQTIKSGFYRNRGVYIVGRIIMKDYSYRPFVLSLENHTRGIFVDAVLTGEADVHNLFSSTLANFHVTIPYYHELAAFLYSVMPQRPLGLHYSTFGVNHLGKVAVVEELRRELMATGELYNVAVGFPGTVAIGFSAPSSDYVLKVIRDEPTEHYKWGAFDGIPAVLSKYSRVHEINRTGSMLDNLIYYNIRLEKGWFAPALMEELLEFAGETVTEQGDYLVFKHLIVQTKMIPLPVFLETASPEDARTAVINLGHCIRNNAAANIFNKDLDGRNYGVSRFLKVYLFDYDAVEPLTDIKIRTNQDRFEGEEDVPDWFFEEGYVFLPEETDVGLRIPDRALQDMFREEHGELMTLDYWEGVQRALQKGLVPRLRVYPDETRLRERRTDASRA
jgi:isocitrate dehydrogenase kinase/phosphatase